MCDQVVLLLISPFVFYGSFYVVAVFANSIAEPVGRVNFTACVAGAISHFFSAMRTVDNFIHIKAVAFDVPVIWYVVWLVSLLIVVPAIKRGHDSSFQIYSYLLITRASSFTIVIIYQI